jgi:5,10-methylenetetrahydromethanopterin reductase
MSSIETAGPELPELGFYGLAGHSDNPRDLIEEVVLAERLGLGSVFLSERFNYKDAAVMAGAAAAVTTRLGIGTAATNHHTRHPVVSATMAATLHRMSEGRYCFGLGRGVDFVWDMYGLDRVTNAGLNDATDVLRKLWRGESFPHDGPIGKFPHLFTMSPLNERIPILMVAIGPKSQEVAGRIADAVVLHTFMTDETVAAAVIRIRRSAEESGRDPSSVRIWACTAVVDDALPQDLRLKKTVGRLSTYLQGYGDVLVKTNGWDAAALQRFREDSVVKSVPGSIDQHASGEQLEHIRDKVIPAQWQAACVTGSARSCAEQVAKQFSDTGVDSIIMHGATPSQLANVVEAYKGVRPINIRRLPTNPGWNHE